MVLEANAINESMVNGDNSNNEIEVISMNNETANARPSNLTLDDLKDSMEVPDYTLVKTLKANQGAIVDSDDNERGTEVTGDLVSYSKLYIITPGVNDSDTRKLIRYTYDKNSVVLDWEDLDNTITADEYVKHLKELGYPKATIKTYYHLVMILDEDDEMVIVQCSPFSVKRFDLFKALTNKKLKSGKISFDEATHIKLKATKEKFGKNSFTAFAFGLA